MVLGIQRGWPVHYDLRITKMEPPAGYSKAVQLNESGAVPCSALVLVSPLDWHMHDVWISLHHPLELYFVIARFLEGGPCQQAAEVCSNSVQFLAENASSTLL